MIKKGSSLILVLIALVVLSIFGAAVISLTASGFKLTKATNEDIRMKYFAEGGLDLALGVIIEEVNGNEVGKDEVDSIVVSIDAIDNDEELVVSQGEKKLELIISAETNYNEILVKSKCVYNDVAKYGNKDIVATGVYSLDDENNVVLESIRFE